MEFHKQKCTVSINSTYNYRTKLQLFPFILCCYLCRKANVKNKTKQKTNLEVALPDLNWKVLLFHFLLLKGKWNQIDFQTKIKQNILPPCPNRTLLLKEDSFMVFCDDKHERHKRLKHTISHHLKADYYFHNSSHIRGTLALKFISYEILQHFQPTDMFLKQVC